MNKHHLAIITIIVLAFFLFSGWIHSWKLYEPIREELILDPKSSYEITISPEGCEAWIIRIKISTNSTIEIYVDNRKILEVKNETSIMLRGHEILIRNPLNKTAHIRYELE